MPSAWWKNNKGNWCKFYKQSPGWKESEFVKIDLTHYFSQLSIHILRGVIVHEHCALISETGFRMYLLGVTFSFARYLTTRHVQMWTLAPFLYAPRVAQCMLNDVLLNPEAYHNSRCMVFRTHHTCISMGHTQMRIPICVHLLCAQKNSDVLECYTGARQW